MVVANKAMEGVEEEAAGETRAKMMTMRSKRWRLGPGTRNLSTGIPDSRIRIASQWSS